MVTRYLKFGDRSGSPVSVEAQDVVRGLLCLAKKRLSFAALKAHPWFRDIDWDRLQERVPPIVPDLDGKADTSNFPVHTPRALPSSLPPSASLGVFKNFDFQRDPAPVVEEVDAPEPQHTEQTTHEQPQSGL